MVTPDDNKYVPVDERHYKQWYEEYYRERKTECAMKKETVGSAVYRKKSLIWNGSEIEEDVQTGQYPNKADHYECFLLSDN